jgi:pimeloyl-ACP methyl ester carboxylesterase
MATSSTGLRWRRRLKRVGIGITALLVVAVAVGSIYERIARRRVARAFPPPGRLVDIGQRRIHLDCRGSGTPIVVLESGLDTSGSALWSLVQIPAARYTRVCSYDRAGLMWSDPSPRPVDGITIANDLHSMLLAAREPGPYVLVGASAGGPYAMIYADRFGEEVAGVVLVDAAHPDQLRRIEAATGRTDEESIPLIFTALARLAWTGLPRLLLPKPEVPELPAAVTDAIAAYQPVSLEASFAEVAAFEATLGEAGAVRSLGDRPLAVLTRGKSYDAYPEAQRTGSGLTREQFDRREAAWHAMQDEEASWSAASTHRTLENSSHVIQLERPDAVVDAIREVVDKVRAKNRSNPSGAGPR